MSGFWDTMLDSTLRALRIDHVLFAGVNVDQCVLATLIDASCAGYDCLLVAGATATTSPPFCAEATFYNVRQCFGFVVDCADVVTAIGAAT
jgi:ureidoacrylate peracid hydrolase